jgi:hypothetical protein
LASLLSATSFNEKGAQRKRLTVAVDHEGIEAAPFGVEHQAVKVGPALFAAADSGVDAFRDGVPPTVCFRAYAARVLLG